MSIFDSLINNIEKTSFFNVSTVEFRWRSLSFCVEESRKMKSAVVERKLNILRVRIRFADID